jgi:sugar phosphate isomerase/epimerase
MSQKYSLAHLTALQCPPPELVYLAARVGYDSVSLRTIPLGVAGEPNYDLASNPRLMRQTRTALDATGLTVNDVELCRVLPDMDPVAYLPCFETAAELGTADVICSVWSPDRGYYIDAFQQICDLAAPYGLRINLEFVAIAAVSTLAQAVDILASVDAKNVGLLLDMYHLHRGNTKPEDLDDLPQRWLHFCQICDAPARIPGSEGEIRTEVRERRLYLGEGAIDVAAFVDRTPEMVYSIEIPNLARTDEFGNTEHAARALESAKTYFRRRTVRLPV